MLQPITTYSRIAHRLQPTKKSSFHGGFFCWIESGFKANQLGSERIVGEHNFKPCEPYDARRTREILSEST